MARDLDVVVFGATGDTGVVGCCYLFFQGKKLGITSWAPAARNIGKLQSDVLDRLENADPNLDGLRPAAPISADASDYEALVKMCKRTKCVLACAGPFSLYGEGVVRACVEAGTNYVDVTGEMDWVEKMQRKYSNEAESKGISVVSCAGYDSIPPDLTAYLAAKAFEKGGQHLQRFEAFVGGGGGALPTGTLNTVLEGISAGKQHFLRSISCGVCCRRSASNGKKAPKNTPLLSAQETERKLVPVTEQSMLKKNLFWTMCPGYSQLAQQFCIPHFMAPINIYNVHRTAVSEGYGGLEYRERMAGLPRGTLSAWGLVPVFISVIATLLLGLFAALPGFAAMARNLRDRYNTPLQQRVRDLVFNGYSSTGKTYVHGYGVSARGHRVNVKMHSKYDPGLGFTMLAACTVAAEIVKRADTPSRARSGFHTAVTALGGDALADALRGAGVSIDIGSLITSKR
jgi:short subunit dehydrogenase-like uncharacterized protein